MITLYHTAALRIDYEPRIRLLELHWLSNTFDSAAFRAAYQQALLLAERYQARAWLTDMRQLPTPDLADLHWLASHWYPRYVQLKLEKVAIISSADPATQQALLTMTRLANEAGHTTRPDAHYFADLAAARQWVHQPLTSSQLPALG